MPLLLHRYHGLLIAAGTVCIVVNGSGIGVLWLSGVGLLLLVGLVLRWALTRAERPPRNVAAPLELRAPVQGRWTALNGPTTKVPSHTHSLAQTYAIDLVRRPAPDHVWVWPIARRAASYPAYGQPLPAPADGRVVGAADGQRDHLSRTSLAGFGYLLVEGFVRSLADPRHVLGNHLVLDLGDGTYAVFAHLRRRSLQVAVDERVSAGQPLAECGNSGNSSEPHLHLQLIDGPDLTSARGVRFTWRYTDDDGRERVGVPADHTSFTPDATAEP